MQFFETFLKILKIYLFLSFRLHHMNCLYSNFQIWIFQSHRKRSACWDGVYQRIIRSWSLLSQTPRSMSRSMWISWTSSQSMTRSSLSQWACTSGNILTLQLGFCSDCFKAFDCSVQWQESRIVTKKDIEPGFWYPMSLEFLDLIWTPNIFIYNLKSFNSAKVLNRLAGICPNIYNESWQILLIKASG